MLRSYYQELIRLRRECAMLPRRREDSIETITHNSEKCLEVSYKTLSGDRLLVVFNFDHSPHTIKLKSREPLVQMLDSNDIRWGGNSAGPRHQKIYGTLAMREHSLQVFVAPDRASTWRLSY
jgi:hypothetical protein